MGKIKKPRNEELAQGRAKRARGVREFLRYSRRKLCEKYDMKASTLQSWEKVRWNGLSEGGAINLARAYQAEGLNVTVEWLLFGIGEDPLKDAYTKRIAKVAPALAPEFETIAVAVKAPKNAEREKIPEDETVAQELRYFHQLHPTSVDALIVDDGLAPWLVPGDRVAGKRLFEEDIEKAVDHICIVQTLTGKVLIRQVKRSHEADRYTLICTNPNTTVSERILDNIKLFSVAPVLWIRKAELS